MPAPYLEQDPMNPARKVLMCALIANGDGTFTVEPVTGTKDSNNLVTIGGGGGGSGVLGTDATPNVSTIKGGSTTNHVEVDSSGRLNILIDGAGATGISQDTGGSGALGWLSSIVKLLRGTLAISATALPLPTNAAQDGTDGTSITPPTGAVGIRGWLSGIYNRLGTSLSITGNVGGKTGVLRAALTNSTSAYAAGQSLGGLQTLSNAVGSALTGILQSAVVVAKTPSISTGLTLHLFRSNPSSSTFTDHGTATLASADIFTKIATIPLQSPTTTLVNETVWELDGIGKALGLTTTTLYAVLTTQGAATFASTSDVTLELAILQD